MMRPALRGARFAAATAAIGVLGAAPSTTAQPASEAQRLFEKGRELFDAGQLDAACDTLAASERLEPAVGVLGLLAACHEKQGRVATAYSEYMITASRARALRDEREAHARARAEALDPLCPDACTDAALVDSYNTTRNVSTVGFIAGGPLLAAGVVLVLTAPPPRATPASASLRLAPGGAVLTGAFR